MPKKLRRRGPTVFHKPKVSKFRVVLRTLAILIVAAGVLTGGYFWAKFAIEGGFTVGSSHAESQPAGQQSGESTGEVSAVAPGPSDTSSPNSEPHPTPNPPELDNLKGFYLPASRLKDVAALDTQLDKAAAAGFNAVIFDLKDSTGTLYYASATELAAQSGAISGEALSAAELTASIQHIQDRGFAAVPRLYAFKDATAPRQLAGAKVTVAGNPTYTWYDDNPNAGGKPWLNPYSPQAHTYIIDMIRELKGLGITTLMIDGVQFPDQESQAGYGTSELTSLSRTEVLSKFVTDASAALDGQLVLSMPSLPALGEETAPYGGNPMTFGSAVVAPNVMPVSFGDRLKMGENSISAPADHPYDVVKLVIGQLQLRIRLMDEDKQPVLFPWLQAYDCSAQSIKDQIRGVTEAIGDDAPYILYNPDGTYDFSALE